MDPERQARLDALVKKMCDLYDAGRVPAEKITKRITINAIASGEPRKAIVAGKLMQKVLSDFLVETSREYFKATDPTYIEFSEAEILEALENETMERIEKEMESCGDCHICDDLKDPHKGN